MSAPVIIYVVSYNIGPYYNGTQLYLLFVKAFGKSVELQTLQNLPVLRHTPMKNTQVQYNTGAWPPR